MASAWSGEASPTCTGWKRRSSAASRSRYFRNSPSVVAPMTCDRARRKGVGKTPRTLTLALTSHNT